MTKISLRALSILSATACFAFTATPAFAQSLQPTPGSPSIAYAVSGDGQVVAVLDISSGQVPSLLYSDGTQRDLSTIFPAGNNGGAVNKLSTDGSVAMGNYYDAAFLNRAFIWTDADGLIDLGDLGQGVPSAQARGMSSNTTTVANAVVVGNASTGLGGLQAFSWTQAGGMVALPYLGTADGADMASAYGASANGSVIVGASDDGSGVQQAVYWQGGNVFDLGIGSIYGASATSGALDVSASGTVIIGTATDGADTRAFRWESGVATILDNAAGGYTSFQPYEITPDGNIIVGTSFGAPNGLFQATRWDETNGTQLLEDILLAANVDLTGWQLAQATGVSDDGSVIVGLGDLNGQTRGFIMSNTAVTTPEELASSLAPLGAVQEQAQGAVGFGLGQSMLTARNALSAYFPRSLTNEAAQRDYPQTAQALDNVAPAAGGSDGLRKAMYVTGTLAAGQGGELSNDSASGTAGMIVQMTDTMALGGGVVISRSNNDTRFGGESRFDAAGVSAFASYEEQPESGIHLYGTAVAARLNSEIDRNYLNGGSIDRSQGETDGWGAGVALRGGYMHALTDHTTVMPYAEVEWSHARLDGYSETGGGAPATVDDQNAHRVVSRLGGELNQKVHKDTSLRMRAAWGHEIAASGDGVNVTAMTVTQTVGGEADKDWLEAGVGMTYRMSERTSLAADVVGRTGQTAEPQAAGTLSLVVNW